MKQLLIALALIVASAAPSIAGEFPSTTPGAFSH